MHRTNRRHILVNDRLDGAAAFVDVAFEAQSEQTLFLLRVFDVGVPLVTSALAIAIMLTYQIGERRAYEIRAELERRRGKLGSDATSTATTEPPAADGRR